MQYYIISNVTTNCNKTDSSELIKIICFDGFALKPHKSIVQKHLTS